MNSRTLLLWTLVAAVASVSRGGAFDPYSLGSHKTTLLAFERVTTIGLSQNVEVWSPVEAGSYPVVFLQDSFGALTPGNAYDDTMGHIASHGFVVVNGWRITGALSYEDKVTFFTETIDWAKQHLEQELHNNGTDASLVVDFDTSFAIGHSAGSHILVQYLKAGCGDFKGLALSSPVDGTESQGQVITDGTVLNFEMPTIVLPAGLDNAKGSEAVPIPCAPDEISNLHFYNALNPNSPRWLVNATEYGHGDYLDQGYLDLLISLHFCASKEGGTLDDFVLYRNFFSGQVVSFFKSLIEEDCETYLPFIEDFASMPVSATGENVNPSDGCPRAYCVWSAP